MDADLFAVALRTNNTLFQPCRIDASTGASACGVP
jgi:hypothetical protein